MSVEAGDRAEDRRAGACMETEDFARVPRVRGEKQSQCSRAIRCHRSPKRSVGRSSRSSIAASPRAWRWADATLPGCRMMMWMKPAARVFAALGKDGLSEGRRAGRVQRAHAKFDVRTLASRAKCSDSATGWRICLCHAGTQDGIDIALQHGGVEAALPAACTRQQAIAALPLSEPRSRLGCHGDGNHGHAGRQCPCAHRRRQDLDLQRWHRGSLRRLCALGRRSGRQGTIGLHGRCRRAGLEHRRAYRRDRAASARHAEIRWLPRAGDQPARRAG